MDTAVVILIIVFLIVLGIFFLTQINTEGSGTGKVSSSSSPQYSSGGGCGR